MLKTSHRISLYITIFVALLTALFFLILNAFFFASWYQNKFKSFQDINNTELEFVPQKEFVRPRPGVKLMRRWQERAIRLSNTSTGRQEQNRYFGIYNIREIDDRRWEVIRSPRGYVLIDVTQIVERQSRLGLHSIVMWLCIVILSFILSGSLVRVSLKDLITLSKSVKNTTIYDLDKLHYFDRLPQDDEINIIASAINTMKRTINNQVISLKEFLAFASHELKTPLMMIQSSAESVQFTKNYKASLLNIKTGVDKMQRIISQLNSFVKLDGKVLMQAQSVDITQLITTIIELLEVVYESKHLTITIGPEEHQIITSYPDVVQSIVSNLIDNACKYADKNGTISIHLSDWWFYISNSGETINAWNLSRIREPFWQQDKTDGHGSGLGLAIVHKAIDRLGWNIQVSSESNLTTFIIYYHPHVKNQ